MANESLTLLSTLRDLFRSVTQRIENYRGNRQQLALLKDELCNAEKKTNVCHITMTKYCTAIGTESLEFELMDIQELVQTMRRVDENVTEVEQSLQQRRRRFREFRRANRIAEAISEQIQIVRDMSSRLSDINENLKAIAEGNDFFSADFTTVPNVRVPVYLDFSSRDTMEGEMKANVLESMERPGHNMGNVHGYVTAVVGVSGMGGVGKTTALLGLAQDPDVRERFSGGIYFVMVGKDATARSLVTCLKEIMRCSGGKRRCEEMDENGSLESAIRTTSSWFSGRKALFICDDLWKTPSCETGYLNLLAGLLDSSPESRMVISTRSITIASETRARVLFEPRSNTGHESRGIFLTSAGIHDGTILDSTCEELMRQVLELCGGVPLMLSIAGAQIRWSRGTAEESLKGLVHSLRDERLLLPERKVGPYPSCFNQAVQANLKAIADALEPCDSFMRAWNEHCGNVTWHAGEITDFVSDCYERLCVLPRSGRVPGEVLFGIWCITNKKLGWSVVDCFVDFHLLLEFKDTHGKPKFGLHDILLDYCERTSQSGPNAKYELYHGEFLSHVWKLCDGESSSAIDTENMLDGCNGGWDACWDLEAVEKCRPWWKTLLCPGEVFGIQDYLLGNLFRHLKESGRLWEAIGVLSHMGWTKLRVRYGGIIALNADFSLIEEASRLHFRGEEDEGARANANCGVKSIWDMVKRAWPILLKNSEALPTHVYGYLMDNENQLALVRRYLQSATDVVNGLWLKPQNAFWRMVDSSSNQRVFRTTERIVDVAISTSSKSVIVATTKLLFWIEMGTMTATREALVRNGEGNQSEISAFCLREEGSLVVLGFNTGELELWNEGNGSLVQVIPNAHGDLITSVAISWDGRRVLSASLDWTVRIWDVESGSAIMELLREDEIIIPCVAMSGDGRTVVSGCWDGTVQVWDVESGSAVGEPLRGHKRRVRSIAISGDGRIAVSGSDDMTMRVWDVEGRSPVCEPLRGHELWVRSIAISGDGRIVASGSGDETVRVWDTESGSEVCEPLRGHELWVTSVAISEDGQTVVSGSDDRTVRIWDGSAVGGPLRGHEREVANVAMSADRRTVVSGSGDSTVRVWDVGSGSEVCEPLRGHERWVASVAISGDGRTVASGSGDRTVRIWDVQSGSAVGAPLFGHERWVRSVAMSGDGRTVVSGSDDGTLRVWDMVSRSAVGEPLRGHESVITSVVISEDGRTAVSGCDDKTVRVWDVQSGSAIGGPLRGHEQWVTSVAISAGRRTVASGSGDTTVRVWDVESGSAVGKPLRGHDGDVRSVAISGDGRIVVSGSYDRTLRIWNLDESECWSIAYVCSLPASWYGVFAYQDGDESCGVVGKLYCPFGRGGASRATLELVWPW